jgi:ketosteroid isomerase-like protein
MSQENADLYRRAVQAFNDGDVDAFLGFMDPEVDAFPRLAPMEGSYRGHDGMRGWWMSLRDTFPDWHTEVVDVLDLGDRTLAELHNRGHGVGSETPVDQRSWHLAEWRDGKVVRWRAYGSEAEAREAAGLGE